VKKQAYIFLDSNCGYAQLEYEAVDEGVPKYASKYRVNINNSRDTIIGDDGQINYYNFADPVPEAHQRLTDQEQTPRVDVLLVAVAEIEVIAVLNSLKEKFNRTYKPYAKGNKTYFDLGEISEARTFMVQSEQGTGSPGGALLTIHESIYTLSPSTIIMVGIAFGLNPQQQQIGTILISQRLQLYEHQRVGTGHGGKQVILPRGDRIQAPTRVLDRFRAGCKNWLGPANVQFGLILSGEKLVDNTAFRDRLRRAEPEAIGGEMEGAGLYAAAHLAKTDWIVVKAICDWADGSKGLHKAEYQRLAADNAARFTFHVIAQGGFSPRIQ
jgi:nucleoside phosphorylase